MDILDELDISNDPEIERLGANATVQYAQEYWNMLYKAAQKDSFIYDPLWSDHDLDMTDENNRYHHNMDSTNHAYSYTQQIVLTQSKEQDYRLYRRFRSNLPRTFWNVERIVMPDEHHISNDHASVGRVNNNPLCGEKWQSLLLACEGVIPDFNFITLLRPNVYDYLFHDDLIETPDELEQGGKDPTSFLSQYIIVPRIQFICIELARCYEGYYSTKKFRQLLQIYTIKGMDEKLYRLFRTELMPALLCDRNGNSSDEMNGSASSLKADLVQTQKAILQQLHCIATEWPYPSIYTLRTTGIVSTLQYILRRINFIVKASSDPQQQSILPPIQHACQQQLQNWHDLVQFRRIEKSFLESTATSTSGSINKGIKSKYNDSIQRLLQKSLHSFTGIVDRTSGGIEAKPLRIGWSMQETLSLGKPDVLLQKRQKYSEDDYVTRTTSKLSDLIISPWSSTTLYNELAHESSDGKRSMASIFRDYGIVVLSNYCTEEQIQQCSQQAYIALERLQQEQLLPRNIQITGQNTFDFIEVRQRPGHRVDNRYKILDEPKSPIATLGKIIAKEIIDKQLFSNKSVGDSLIGEKQFDKLYTSSSWKLLYAGVVHAFPRENESMEYPPPQFWHRDGPSLFEGQDVHHHTTHCFNVFVPLIDVAQENGTTEFVPGTHEDKRYNKVVADILLNCPEKFTMDAGIVRADLKEGSLIIFDVRVLHRGLSNQSTAERPMLYYTFGRDWFQEEHMFQKIESLLATENTSNDGVLESSIFNLCKALITTVAGKQLSRTDSQFDFDTSCKKKMEYGHPHYTLRFDLLLLEQWMISTTGTGVEAISAISNYSAVLRFHNLSRNQKDLVCQDFIRILSSSEAWEMKHNLLQQTRRKREEQRLRSTEHIEDFASIQQDMTDVAALYKLTVQLLFTQSSQHNSKNSLLSQMGFSEDENGIYVALALLKVYTIVESNDSCSANGLSSAVPYAEMEECFTLWWNAAPTSSRFHLITSTYKPAKDGNGLRSVIVVFSSLGSGLCRPEWMGTVKAIGISEQLPQVDVLHVLDFACSWYCQDPTCTWNGYSYYMKELNERLKSYSKVLFLGDSMGGSAALRFSSLAQSVLVFTPQIDITNYEAVTRKDFTRERREQFRREIIDAMRDENNKAIVTIHYGAQCIEDVRQLQPLILNHKPNVHFISHDFDDHVLSMHLRDLGKLTGLVHDAIVKKFLSL